MLLKTIALLVFVEFSGFLAFILLTQYPEFESFRYYPLYCSVGIAFIALCTIANKISHLQLLKISFFTTTILLILYLILGFTFFPGLVKDEELFSFHVIHYSLFMVSLGTTYHFFPLSFIRFAKHLATRAMCPRDTRQTEKHAQAQHHGPDDIVGSVYLESASISHINPYYGKNSTSNTIFFHLCIGALYLYFIESSALVAYSITINTPLASTMTTLIGLATSLAICCAAAMRSSWYSYRSLFLISLTASWLTVSLYYQMRFDHCQPGAFGDYIIANTGMDCSVIIYIYALAFHFATLSFFKYANRWFMHKYEPTPTP